MSETLTGCKIGQYELHEVIGRGGMAVIYRASQPRMDRDVAIKVIAGSYAHHPAFIRRFEDEVRVSARLQHPHILPVYDVGSEEELLYLVMAHMPGGTLAKRIAAAPGGLPFEEIVCVTTQVASALDHAHAQGIIHCDLKPGNILLDGRGNAYLGDFGIAQIGTKEQPPSQGTYAYMAPELIDDIPATPASDIYSLGVVVFEMLTGSRPFEAHSRQALREAYADWVLPGVRQKRADAPSGVQVVLEQALNKDPNARPFRATSLAQTLMRACGFAGLPCTDVGSDEADPSLGVQRLDDLLDLRTPPPLVSIAGWPPVELEADPIVLAIPEREALPTAVAAPTRMLDAGAFPRRKRHPISPGRLLLLIWLAGLCLLCQAAAVVVLVMPALNR